MNFYFLSVFLIVLIFILSGIHKLFDINGTANLLQSKFNVNVPHSLYVLAIVAVIIILIGCSSSLLHYAATKKHATLAFYSTILLICFTILATLIFHVPPVKKNYYSFMSNMSLVGGLLLILNSLPYK